MTLAVGLTDGLGLDGDRCIRVIPRHLQVSVCPQGEEYLGRYTPWVGTPPRQVHPQAGPPRQVPPGQVPPTGRYTPCRQVHTPQAGTPPKQVPPRQAPSPRQVHPPITVHTGIRSTSGRYASHWNAFLFGISSYYFTCTLVIQCLFIYK